MANNILSPTIIGGSVTARNEFPWQVLLVITKWNGGSYYCGASLISNQWVLTAAHCLDRFLNIKFLDLKFNIKLILLWLLILLSAHSANLYLGAQDITINEPNRIGFTSNQWLIHPQWNSNTLFADIALIKLPVMINFNGMFMLLIQFWKKISTIKLNDFKMQLRWVQSVCQIQPILTMSTIKFYSLVGAKFPTVGL